MRITSVAVYLVDQMVRSTSGLQKQNKENTTNQGVVSPQRDKSPQRTTDGNRAGSSSSAYRVTISSAAMQKMAAGGV